VAATIGVKQLIESTVLEVSEQAKVVKAKLKNLDDDVKVPTAAPRLGIWWVS
jgi:hypothetical protein